VVDLASLQPELTGTAGSTCSNNSTFENRGLVFAKPCEENVEFSKFIASLQNESDLRSYEEVPYLSQQCDCFRNVAALTKLLPDILMEARCDVKPESQLKKSRLAQFGFSVFGNNPDAVSNDSRVPKVATMNAFNARVLYSLFAYLFQVNLWIGDSRSITTAHKDHYENL
jgi:hypothetical protein